MLLFSCKKIVGFFFSLFLLLTAAFFLLHSLPGDPFSGDAAIPDEVKETLRSHFGLNLPLSTQYIQYLKGCLTLDFGPSMLHIGRSVGQIIGDGFSVTALLGLQAFALSLFLGITLGCAASLYRSKKTDALIMMGATIGLTVPNFVIATVLQHALALKLHIFPVAAWGSYKHTILPTIALSFLPTAYIARLVRTSMVEVLSQNYIQAAYAKGLSHLRVVFWHALPNALLPLLSYTAPLFTFLLTGSFAIEKIFGIPGLGQWTVMSILHRDYSTVMGLILLYGGILIFCNLLSDLLAAYFQPRMKL